jgi:hypothetical protein
MLQCILTNPKCRARRTLHRRMAYACVPSIRARRVYWAVNSAVSCRCRDSRGVPLIARPVRCTAQGTYQRRESAVMDARTILENVREVSARFATERRERQQRRGLVAADFAQLREAGFPLTGVPVDQGGIWESVRQSTRPL